MNVQKKIEIINRVLDKEIKNLHPSKRVLIFDYLMNIEFTSIKTCWEETSKKLGLKKAITSRSKEYWIIRGWDELTSKFKSKEISKTTPSNSPYTIEHWTKKINPISNKNYTEQEAKFECNRRRPIKMEYWVERGFSAEEAKKRAIEHKKNNDTKAAKASSTRSTELKKLSSNRSIEYWLMRGYTREDAIKKISNLQSTFTYEKCVEKYGETEGKKIWGRRQNKWIKSLSASGLKSGFSKISQDLFIRLYSVFPEILFGNNEIQLTVNEYSYIIDCIHCEKKKIIEFYGNYWHANPTRFNENDLIHRKIAKDIWKKDARKINDLNQLGYDVLIVWESDFKNNPEETIEKCIQFLNK